MVLVPRGVFTYNHLSVGVRTCILLDLDVFLLQGPYHNHHHLHHHNLSLSSAWSPRSALLLSPIQFLCLTQSLNFIS